MSDEFPVISRPLSPGTMVGYRLHRANYLKYGQGKTSGVLCPPG